MVCDGLVRNVIQPPSSSVIQRGKGGYGKALV